MSASFSTFTFKSVALSPFFHTSILSLFFFVDIIRPSLAAVRVISRPETSGLKVLFLGC